MNAPAEIGDKAVCERLVWRLSEVKVCPIHQATLCCGGPARKQGGQIQAQRKFSRCLQRLGTSANSMSP